jgi:hypothetical protein
VGIPPLFLLQHHERPINRTAPLLTTRPDESGDYTPHLYMPDLSGTLYCPMNRTAPLLTTRPDESGDYTPHLYMPESDESDHYPPVFCCRPDESGDYTPHLYMPESDESDHYPPVFCCRPDESGDYTPHLYMPDLSGTLYCPMNRVTTRDSDLSSRQTTPISIELLTLDFFC